MAMAPHITRKFLWWLPGRMIVQTWRGSNWKRSDPDSILVLTFARARGGARLMTVHANVPDANAKSITRGWHAYSWRPWKAYLRKKGRRRG